MPIPKGVEIVDLALCEGVPTFQQALDAILDEAEVEYFTIAEEIVENNPKLYKYIREKMPEAEYSLVSHTELKEMSRDIKFAVRTGEFTPYPNVILRSGVVFS